MYSVEIAMQNGNKMNTQTPETRRRIAQFKRVLAAATAINDLMGDPVHGDVFADLEATLETMKRVYDIKACEECNAFIEAGQGMCIGCTDEYAHGERDAAIEANFYDNKRG